MPEPHPCATIRAFHALPDGTGTAGQPTEAELADIARAGYQLVVNLAMPTSPGALPDEPAIAARHGMRHVDLPIDWDKPDPASARELFRVLEENRGRPVFVHCALNMRVSALMFAYRVARLGVSREEAAADLHEIWEPNEIWSRYVEEVIAANRPQETAPR
jgi:protein tyrosine phosphatase (PTP) superfamily phosphohydrolase (DUF442 family)